jgi:hypothetical protein
MNMLKWKYNIKTGLTEITKKIRWYDFCRPGYGPLKRKSFRPKDGHKHMWYGFHKMQRTIISKN